MKSIRIVLAVVLGLAVAGGIGWRLQTYRHRVVKTVRGFPAGIVIHHTATPPVMRGRPVDVATIDALHARRGFRAVDRDGTVYHIGYHFLIQQDGTVLRGRPEHLRGSHAMNHNDMLGIALVGDFHRRSNRGRCGPLTPPRAQLRAAETLTQELMAKYGLSRADVYLHRDLGQTACPGDQFPRNTFYALIPAAPPPPRWWSGWPATW